MAINESQKVDWLWKKLGYGVAKTDINSIKNATNESIASPLLIRGDSLWTDSTEIPSTKPTASSANVEIYDDSGNGTATIECTPDLTASPNRTWKTNLIDWIPVEFGSTYQIKVYIDNSPAAAPETTGTQLFAAGSGNNDEWYFDYQSGVLNFIGDNLPTGISGKRIYIVGARYIGNKGTNFSNITATTANLGNFFFSANTMSTTNTNGDIILDPDGSGRIILSSDVKVDSTGAITIPVGTTLERPSTLEQGMIRYNITDSTFEGYDGTNWGSLGGVKDVDQDTYIIAETSAGADNDQLDFYTAGTQALQIDADGDFKFGDGLNKFTIDWATGDTDIAGNLDVGGNITLTGDITIGGNTTGGDADTDTVTFLADVTSNIIPDTADTYDLGATTKAWRDIYLTEDLTFEGATGENQIVLPNNLADALSITDGTNDLIVFGTQGTGLVTIDATVTINNTLEVNGESTLQSAIVEDLTDNRIVIAGTSGALEDDANLTFDGTELAIGVTNFTVDHATGNVYSAGTLETDGEATLASAIIEDLTNDRILLAGTGGAVEDDANLTFNGTELAIGVTNFTVQQATGNTAIAGTLDVDGQSTFASANVEDLTSGRVVLAGTDGELEDSANLTFDGTTLTVTGSLDVTVDVTLASAKVSDLTDNRIVIAGTDGELEDDANFTFDGTSFNISNTFAVDVATGNTTTTGNLTVGGTADVSSDFSVATTKFTVASATGNTITEGTLRVDGDTDLNANLTVDGNVTLGSAATDTVTFNADVNSNILPSAASTYNLGAIGAEWANLYVDNIVLGGDSSTTGDQSVGGDLDVTGQSTLASVNVTDLTQGRIVIVGVNGELEDDANFRFDGNDFMIGAAGSETFNVDVATGNTDVSGNLAVGGNLTVNGTVTTVNSTTVTIDDPIFTLGGDTAPTSDDNKDRGIEFRWHTGANAKLGFFGYDDSAGTFTFIPDATNNSEVFSGAAGDVVFGEGTFTGVTAGNIQVAVTDDNTIDTSTGNLTINSNGGITTIDDDVSITETLDVDGQATLASANVEDLTNNRIVIAGVSGELEDDPNFTFDSTTFNVGAAGEFTVDVATGNTAIAGSLDVDGGATISTLKVDDLVATEVVYATTDGKLESSVKFTFDETDVIMDSAIVSDLTNDRIVIAGTSGALEDDANFTFNSNVFNIGQGEFTVATANGNTAVAGTLDVDGQATLASANIEDLTSGRVVLAGTDGELEDSANLTFNGTILTVTGALQVDNINIDTNDITSTDTNGNINITPDGTGEVVISTATISDLTDNRIVLAGTAGSLEDDANLTFDGTTFNIGATAEFTVDVATGNTQVKGTLDVDGQATLASANVEDLTDNEIVIAGPLGELEGDSNFRFDGTDFMIGASGTETFTVNVATGDVTLNDLSGATLSSSDLTNDRVVIVGTGGVLEDSADFTFNGTALNVGQGVFTAEVATGNTNVNGTLTVGESASIGSATGSTSTSTGALTIVGGTGIGENLYVGGNVAIDGTLGADGGVTLGDDVNTDVLTLNATITNSMIPTANDSYDIGSNTLAWQRLYLSESVNFTGATTENEIIVPTNLADALSVTESSGDLILIDTTSGARSITLYPNTTIEGTLTVGTSVGTTTISEILDEDTMVSDSDTALATQQSIKAYVDSVEANVAMEFQGDTGTEGSVNLRTEVFDILGTANEIETASNGTQLTIGLPDDVTIGNDLTVTNDLTVSGDTATFDVGTLAIEDPIITIAGTAAPTANDSLDKGIEFHWYTGTTAKLGFFGYDESAGTFTFIPDATNTNELISGTAGDVVFGEGTFTGTTSGNITVGVTDDNTITTTSGSLTIDSTDGTVTVDDNLTVTGEATLASAIVQDLSNDRIVVVGSSNELEDDSNFRFDGTNFMIGASGSEKFDVSVATGNTDIAGTLNVTGDVDFAGNVSLGDALTDNIFVNGSVATHIIPDNNDARDLGSNTNSWRDLYLTESINFLGATSENEIIIPTNLADSLSIKDTAGDLIVITTTTGSQLVTIVPNVQIDGTFTLDSGVTVQTILDEDTMVSDSDTALATQQSIKAYVDNSVSDVDLNFAGDSGTGSVNLLTQSFTLAGTANEIETSALDQTITIGLPDDVIIGNDLTVTNDLNVNNDVTITGNLTVNGTTTTVSTTELVVEDNIITLNNGESGAGVTAGSAGIEVDRGTETTVSFVWDEANDRWTTGTDDLEAGEFYGTIDGGTF